MLRIWSLIMLTLVQECIRKVLNFVQKHVFPQKVIRPDETSTRIRKKSYSMANGFVNMTASSSGAEAVEDILNEYRLGIFLPKLLDLGVECVEDLADLRTDDLEKLGFSQIQRNRFREMASTYGLDLLGDISSSSSSLATSSQSISSTSSYMERSIFSTGCRDYVLFYQTQHHVLIGSTEKLTNLDPYKITLKDLVEIILRNENFNSTDHSAELYTQDGTPLTNDFYLAAHCSLSTRCIESKSTIFAIICKGGRHSTAAASPTMHPSTLPNRRHVLNCCLVTGEHYKIPVDIDEDTPKDVKSKLAVITGIPEKVQILKVRKVESFQLDMGATLAKNDLQANDWLNVYLVQPQELNSHGWEDNFTCEIQPYVKQTDKGMGMFAASLYVASHILANNADDDLMMIGAIRRLTGLSPLATALYMLSKRLTLAYAHKVAIVEGLYLLFRRLLPKGQGRGYIGGDQVIPDDCVFEHSNICWMYLMKLKKSTDGAYGEYKEVQIRCSGSNTILIEPVTVSSIPGKYFSRSYVLTCMEEKKDVNGKLVSDPSSLNQDFEMQKILLSFLNMSGLDLLGFICKTCFVWKCASQVKSDKAEYVEPMNIKNFRKEEKDGRFELCATLSLSECCSNVAYLTLNEKYEYVVFTGNSKQVGALMQLYNPATGETEKADRHKLAYKLEDFDFKKDTGALAKSVAREPHEAIIVVLDISSSMGCSCYDSEMSRLVAAKELFYAFIERTMAYNLQHSIGLTTFDKHVNVIGKCNGSYESFKQLLESVTTGRGTALFDAICNAVDQLRDIKRIYPNCKRRVICLTDGIDLNSKETAEETVTKLKTMDCVLDAVQITSVSSKKQIFHVLKSIAFATGGCCFKPASLPEGRKVFEMETVLSIRTRKMTPNPRSSNPGQQGVYQWFTPVAAATVTTTGELKKLASRPWTTELPCNKPEALTKPVAKAHAVLVKASGDKRVHTTKDRSKRLLREMAAMQRDPHPAFSIYPSENQFDFWKILMVGPTDTPYETGVFTLYAEFPKNYPDAPPTVRFLTPIYHCNINSIGRICHSIFDRNYTSDTNMKIILSCVFGLLMTPEPKDPLDGVLAEEYFTNRDLYNQKAKEWTKKHASTSLKDSEQEMLDSSTLPRRKPPNHLICPLTKQLFVDPVQTPYGHVYERQAIETAINKVPCDPEAEEPLIKADLIPAIAVRRQATDFRESLSKVAACWLN